MSKAGWVLVAVGVGVVGVIAYLAWRTLKPVSDVTGQVSGGLRGIQRGFDAITGDFGAAAHGISSGVAFGVDTNKALYGNAGAAITNLFNKTQAPTQPVVWTPTPAEQAVEVTKAYVWLGGSGGPAQAMNDEAQQIARASQGGVGGL